MFCFNPVLDLQQEQHIPVSHHPIPLLHTIQRVLPVHIAECIPNHKTRMALPCFLDHTLGNFILNCLVFLLPQRPVPSTCFKHRVVHVVCFTFLQSTKLRHQGSWVPQREQSSTTRTPHQLLQVSLAGHCNSAYNILLILVVSLRHQFDGDRLGRDHVQRVRRRLALLQCAHVHILAQRLALLPLLNDEVGRIKNPELRGKLRLGSLFHVVHIRALIRIENHLG
mmetsp:Transcript_6431/g.15525  ORF Transcript_6431/g.15525 Transcript_6431/m.15525 type:complete len:224 (-) Transcript_6431:38-709(-)